jgi:hypothetical protein
MERRKMSGIKGLEEEQPARTSAVGSFELASS